MQIVFMGTLISQMGALEAWIAQGHEITVSDGPAGQGKGKKRAVTVSAGEAEML